MKIRALFLSLALTSALAHKGGGYGHHGNREQFRFNETTIPEECRPTASALESEPDLGPCIQAIEDQLQSLPLVPEACQEAIDEATTVREFHRCFRAISFLQNIPEECVGIQDEEALRECFRENHDHRHIGKQPSCVRQSKRALAQCLMENRVACAATCAGVSLDFDRPNRELLETCQDIQELVIDQFCEVTSCCEPCSGLFLEFSECVVNRAVNHTGVECDFECPASSAPTVTTAATTSTVDATTTVVISSATTTTIPVIDTNPTTAAAVSASGGRRLGHSQHSESSDSPSFDEDSSSDSDDEESSDDSSGGVEICGTDSLDGQPADIETFIDEALCVVGEYEGIIDGTSSFSLEADAATGSLAPGLLSVGVAGITAILAIVTL